MLHVASGRGVDAHARTVSGRGGRRARSTGLLALLDFLNLQIQGLSRLFLHGTLPGSSRLDPKARTTLA